MTGTTIACLAPTTAFFGGWGDGLLPAAGGNAPRTSGRLTRVLRRQPDGSWKVARSIWSDGDAGARRAREGG